MCDSFVYVPNDQHSPVIFGKNSDREPNEAQQVVRYAAHIRKDQSVQATYIKVDTKREVNEVILSKPFQMWGAEMGVNEHGVAIGNEAVFTRMDIVKRNIGLTGMDMVRLGLEAGRTAEDALQIIIQYLESAGQNACGGYRDSKFFYHNSFIIADYHSAYILETAGPYWAYEQVQGYRAISNGLSIETGYDAIADGAIDFARSKRWARSSGDFNFRKAFSAYWMPRLASCDVRRTSSESAGKKKGKLTVIDAFGILRSHAEDDFRPANSSTESLCMHASGLLCPHQTTGSMVAELRKQQPITVWLTASSSPCLSLYKPFYLGSDVLDPENFSSPGAIADNSYWWAWENFHRRALLQYPATIRQIRNDQRLMENMWTGKDADLITGTIGGRENFSRQCLDDSLDTLESWISGLESGHSRSYNFMYRRFWKRLNKQVNL